MNEDGIAYALIAVVVFLVGGGLLYICLLPIVTAILDHFNLMVLDGGVTKQTAGMVGWSAGLLTAVPVIGLIGISVWAYIRALERREVGPQ